MTRESAAVLRHRKERGLFPLVLALIIGGAVGFMAWAVGQGLTQGLQALLQAL